MIGAIRPNRILIGDAVLVRPDGIASVDSRLVTQDLHPLEIYGPGEPLLARLREICLAFPEAVEAGGVGAPSFKVREKIFAMQHRMDGRPSLWVKGLPGAQDVLTTTEPDRFFRPPYVGQHGWVGAWIDDDAVDWGHLATLVDESYRITAPKRLVRLLEG